MATCAAEVSLMTLCTLHAVALPGTGPMPLRRSDLAEDRAGTEGLQVGASVGLAMSQKRQIKDLQDWLSFWRTSQSHSDFQLRPPL